MLSEPRDLVYIGATARRENVWVCCLPPLCHPGQVVEVVAEDDDVAFLALALYTGLEPVKTGLASREGLQAEEIVHFVDSLLADEAIVEREGRLFHTEKNFIIRKTGAFIRQS